MGKELKRLNLRGMWSHEALDFTPWLAGHIDILGRALGLKLRALESEKPVGDFRLDILCQDTNTFQYVVVENQLDGLDHKHIGQLLSYASGVRPTTLVWVAGGIRKEHIATIQWLNEVLLGSGIQAFGALIQLWSVGHYKVVPVIKVVASPSEFIDPFEGSLQRALSMSDESFDVRDMTLTTKWNDVSMAVGK